MAKMNLSQRIKIENEIIYEEFIYTKKKTFLIIQEIIKKKWAKVYNKSKHLYN